MRKLSFEYCIRFGKLDSSDMIPYEMEITEQEAANPHSPDILKRAAEEIYDEVERINAEVGEEFDDDWTIYVQPKY